MECYDVMKSLYNALIDEESEDWFNARIEYMITRDSDAFLKSVFAIFRKYKKRCHHIGMKRFVQDKNYKGIIIYGCGHDGKLTKEILNLCGYSVSFWCDSNQHIVGNNVDGLRVVSTEELVEKFTDYLVVIGSVKYMDQIKERLWAFGFPLDRVAIFSDSAYDWAVTGIQYFDMFSPDDKEIFIDGGAYNGDTVYDFLAWNKENEYKVYSFEPMKGMYEFIKKRLEKDNITNVNVLNFAAWAREEQLNFADMGDGSRVSRDGRVRVNGVRIDDIVGTDEVTFIKLDVEGAELEALKGASGTIRTYHPKLAICIYHKPSDILDIGKYILELNPNYRLAIRHYTLTNCETVLYAIP